EKEQEEDGWNARPHPGPAKNCLSPRLRPQPQERGKHTPRPVGCVALAMPEEFSRQRRRRNDPPSPGGEGRGEGGRHSSSFTVGINAIPFGTQKEPILCVIVH